MPGTRAPQPGGHLGPVLGGRGGELLAQQRGRGAPRAAARSPGRPARRCRRRAGRGHAGRRPRWPPARAARTGHATAAATPMSPRKSEITTTRPRRRGGRRSCSSSAGQITAGALGARGDLGDLADHAAGVREPAAGRDRGRLSRRSTTSAPIRLPPPRGQVRDRGHRGDGQVALLARRRCRSRGSRDRSITIHVSSSRSATVSRMCGIGRAGGDRPVHPAHVVAGLVGRAPRPARSPAPAPGRGGCPAAARRGGAARRAPACAARPPSRSPRRTGGAQRRALAASPVLTPAGLTAYRPADTGGCCGRADTCGNGTVCSTRVMMWSIGTPSASAS